MAAASNGYHVIGENIGNNTHTGLTVIYIISTNVIMISGGKPDDITVIVAAVHAGELAEFGTT